MYITGRRDVEIIKIPRLCNHCVVKSIENLVMEDSEIETIFSSRNKLSLHSIE